MIEIFTTTPDHCTMAAIKKHQIPTDLYDAMRPENIGYRLRLIRIAHGMRPSDMADLLGVERTYWSRFEGGKRAVNDTVAALLVDRFGITLDFLILGKWDKLPIDVSEKLRRAASDA